RRVAFLRVALAPEGVRSEHTERALLEAIRGKVIAFGGALEGISPLGVTAVFGVDSVEDASIRAAHAAAAIRKLVARMRNADAVAPTATLAIHSAPALLCNLPDGIHVCMDARADARRALRGLRRR